MSTMTARAPGLTGMMGRSSGRTLLDKVLLAMGIIASIYYVVAYDVIAATQYPGYDRVSRPVSELSATYAPTKDLVGTLFIFYGLAAAAFWIGVWRAARGSRSLRITSALMLAELLLAMASSAFPMRSDEVLGANTVHTIIYAAIVPTLILAGIGSSAWAFGKPFRVYVVLTLLALIAFSIWTGIEAGRVNAGGTSLTFGVAERGIQGAWLQWVAVLAIALLRRPALAAPIRVGVSTGRS